MGSAGSRSNGSLSSRSDPWVGRFSLPYPTQVGGGTDPPQCCWNCGHCKEHSQTGVRRSDGHGACRLQLRGQSLFWEAGSACGSIRCTPHLAQRLHCACRPSCPGATAPGRSHGSRGCCTGSWNVMVQGRSWTALSPQLPEFKCLDSAFRHVAILPVALCGARAWT